MTIAVHDARAARELIYRKEKIIYMIKTLANV